MAERPSTEHFGQPGSHGNPLKVKLDDLADRADAAAHRASVVRDPWQPVMAAIVAQAKGEPITEEMTDDVTGAVIALASVALVRGGMTLDQVEKLLITGREWTTKLSCDRSTDMLGVEIVFDDGETMDLRTGVGASG